jgi:ubiquinone/menaquinone biosynthesis C-methylase UbiE
MSQTFCRLSRVWNFPPSGPVKNWEDEMSEGRATAFKGTFAELYDRYLVPMLFAPYARILADHASDIGARSILEIAAGTGIAALELVRALSAGTAVIATDLSQPMIDIARAKPGMTNVVWQQADAMRLPFNTASKVQANRPKQPMRDR